MEPRYLQQYKDSSTSASSASSISSSSSSSSSNRSNSDLLFFAQTYVCLVGARSDGPLLCGRESTT